MTQVDMTKAVKGATVDCGHCGGCGWYSGMDCCGNYHDNGECKAFCVIPVQQPCQGCNGCGQIEVPA